METYIILLINFAINVLNWRHPNLRCVLFFFFLQIILLSVHIFLQMMHKKIHRENYTHKIVLIHS